jgi:hypothetical protein
VRRRDAGGWPGLFLVAIVCCILALASCRTATTATEATSGEGDRWGPLRLLVGTWDGEIDGQLGRGKGVREYEFMLD